ncbi:hypothetical protein M011DRAFT_472260 [Sporormia fimetaria CBS 119925]|uniref:Uncharacterized protein n=1 Tax=Sporormia fimetaria CBS 119925 TaxID=1340428 RepID=A0A6A6UZ91_9PLEO|nr:hypothetical protein M011DRAFT_472260 [Sporormia fimetaria CBS 119925]
MSSRSRQAPFVAPPPISGPKPEPDPHVNHLRPIEVSANTAPSALLKKKHAFLRTRLNHTRPRLSRRLSPSVSLHRLLDSCKPSLHRSGIRAIQI